MGDVLQLLRDSYLLDVLDIVLVALLFYRLYLIVRGTRATEMFVGLAILFGFSIVAQSLGLLLLNRIIVSLQTVWLIAFIIIFQPELRGALSYLGKTRYFRFFVREREPAAVGELTSAVQRLHRSGLGAIIVFERSTGLNDHIHTGTVLDAEISAELVETIFTPPTPLHDGAVIIREERIAAAGCILPLSRNDHLAYTLGTRHRAALGITEISDAFVIVVSEESRQISVAQEGRLRRRLSLEKVRREIADFYRSDREFESVDLRAGAESDGDGPARGEREDEEGAERRASRVDDE